MICFYRYSDKGKNPIDFGYPFTKTYCFETFSKIFSSEKIIIIADNCSQKLPDCFSGYDIIETNLGNSKSASFLFEECLKYDFEIVYFVEDDYLHTDASSPKLIQEALQIADYCTLYDHGDKYRNFNSMPNPLLANYGEITELFRTQSSHWKLTNSTTFTFATTKKTLSEDFRDMQRFCIINMPYDFQMFSFLREEKGRKLASCIPSRSTHLPPNHEDVSPFFFQ